MTGRVILGRDRKGKTTHGGPQSVTPDARGVDLPYREVTFQEDIVRSSALRKLLAFARILIGWTFMWPFLDKLFGFGLAMLLGAGLKIAAWSGTLLLFLMYLAQFPQGQPADFHATNPITDSHWHEAALLLLCASGLAGDTVGIGKWWGRKVGNGVLR